MRGSIERWTGDLVEPKLPLREEHALCVHALCVQDTNLHL